MSAPSASMEQTRALQRPHNTFALTGQCKKTTARSGLNDRTIRPQRPHNSAATTARFSPNVCRPPQRSSEGFFPSPSSSSAGKEKRLRAFLKTFRAFQEKNSGFEAKRFGVFQGTGKFPVHSLPDITNYLFATLCIKNFFVILRLKTKCITNLIIIHSMGMLLPLKKQKTT